MTPLLNADMQTQDNIEDVRERQLRRDLLIIIRYSR